MKSVARLQRVYGTTVCCAVRAMLVVSVCLCNVTGSKVIAGSKNSIFVLLVSVSSHRVVVCSSGGINAVANDRVLINTFTQLCSV